MLLTAESLLLRRSRNPAVHHQRSGRIMIKGGNTENFHESDFFSGNISVILA